jgi:hypothetical protein
LDDSDPDNLQWERMSGDEVQPFIHRQTKLSPFEQMHAKYNAEWEKDALERWVVSWSWFATAVHCIACLLALSFQVSKVFNFLAPS